MKSGPDTHSTIYFLGYCTIKLGQSSEGVSWFNIWLSVIADAEDLCIKSALLEQILQIFVDGATM